MLRAAWCLPFVFACAKAAEPAAPEPPQFARAVPMDAAALGNAAQLDAAVLVDAAAPDAGVPQAGRTTYRCNADATAEKACLARGSGFAYGPTPFIYCSGVAANTGALAEEHAKRQETAPCVCNDLAAIAQRRDQCSRVPSMRR